MFKDIFKDVSVTTNEHKELNNFPLKDIQDLVDKCKELNLNRIPPEPVFLKSELCADRVQFRFPHSKKSRIRKKWSKRPENYKDIPKMFKLGDKIVGHPSLINQIKQEIPIRGKRQDMCLIDDFTVFNKNL